MAALSHLISHVRPPAQQPYDVQSQQPSMENEPFLLHVFQSFDHTHLQHNNLQCTVTILMYQGVAILIQGLL